MNVFQIILAYVKLDLIKSVDVKMKMKVKRLIVVGATALILVASSGSVNGQTTPRTETIIRNLEIPWAMDFATDGRAFLTERPGRIRIIRAGQLDPKPWAILDVAHVGEGGLLGLAVGPDFARTKFVYVYHTFEQDGKLWNRVLRMVERAGQGAVDRVLLDRIPGAQVHDGGRIKFGPDGKLYITTGDARQPSLAQDRSSLAGKILRINPDGSIPADNPFPNSPVYTIGNRNGQGLAWHPETKAMFESEHGPSGEFGLCCHDELNLIKPGKNYGWPAVAGMGGAPRYVDPIAESGATATWAPSGILIPTSGPWRGSVLMACLRGVHLRRFVLAPPDFRRVQSQEVYFEGELGRLRDVVQSPDGTIYLLTSNRDGRGKPTPEDDRVLRIVFR